MPRLKMPQRMALRFQGRRLRAKRLKAIPSMMRSELMLSVALVMRWFVAASHCGLGVGNAQ